jgi:hypothetical protein
MISIKITLDDILKIVQIIFYIIGVIIAILTYRSAKKGLLNTVNTEYKRIVIMRLKELSDELASEFNPNSPNYWVKTISIKEQVDEINKEFLKSKESILKSGSFKPGIKVMKDQQRLESLIQNIQTDPFLPREIRTKVFNSLNNRSKTMEEIYIDELRKYASLLAEGKNVSPKELEMNWARVHNIINHRLYESGVGISQIEEETGNIRLEIQKYFESFDPLPKVKSKNF